MTDNYPIERKPKGSYTQAALSMLTCCMQKISGEIISTVGNKATPSYFDKMAGIVMGLGETIYKIENDKFDNSGNDSEVLDDEDYMITLTPDV